MCLVDSGIFKMFSSSTDLQAILSEKLGKPVFIETISPVGGGCINETAKVKSSAGVFFAKWNDAKRYPQMLEAEAKGLKILHEADELKVPDVIVVKTIGDRQYLVLEFIESSGMQKHFWHHFGKALAKLHKYSAEKFGLNHNNYIGSLPQSNRMYDSWTEFFILERLEPQVKMARDDGKIGNAFSQKFEKLFSVLENIFPVEKPALLHGDLWSGNYMTGSRGEAVIIDPAVYYGHREMDLGMTMLFGGFSSEFYSAYNEEFPLEKDRKKRTDICNLYPLMVHTNLFGGSYGMQVESILRRF